MHSFFSGEITRYHSIGASECRCCGHQVLSPGWYRLIITIHPDSRYQVVYLVQFDIDRSGWEVFLLDFFFGRAIPYSSVDVALFRFFFFVRTEQLRPFGASVSFRSFLGGQNCSDFFEWFVPKTRLTAVCLEFFSRSRRTLPIIVRFCPAFLPAPRPWVNPSGCPLVFFSSSSQKSSFLDEVLPYGAPQKGSSGNKMVPLPLCRFAVVRGFLPWNTLCCRHQTDGPP